MRKRWGGQGQQAAGNAGAPERETLALEVSGERAVLPAPLKLPWEARAASPIARPRRRASAVLMPAKEVRPEFPLTDGSLAIEVELVRIRPATETRAKKELPPYVVHVVELDAPTGDSGIAFAIGAGMDPWDATLVLFEPVSTGNCAETEKGIYVVSPWWC